MRKNLFVAERLSNKAWGFIPRGFTLIEMMVIIALISIILGIGSAFFTNFQHRLALPTAAMSTAALLESAKAASLQENAFTTVKIFPKENVLQVWTTRIAGYWSLEDTSANGAFGIPAKAKNVLSAQGKIGKCLHFEAGLSKLILGAFGRFGLQEGFTLSFWVYPEKMAASHQQVLWEIPDFYILGMQEDYTLFIKAPQITPTSINFRLPLYQWSFLEIADDHSSISLAVDGIPRIKKAYEGKPAVVYPRSLIHLGEFFQGKIDEVKLFSHTISMNFTLPQEIEIRKSPDTILFTPQGYLDPSKHLGSTSILLGKFETSEETLITISEIGQIKVQE